MYSPNFQEGTKTIAKWVFQYLFIIKNLQGDMWNLLGFFSVAFLVWVLYLMIVHFTMRTYGVNQAFGFVEIIWLHRKSLHI